MELKEITIIKLRKNIEEQLAKVENPNKIHIDKEILDKLLFYKTKIGNKEIKIPVWSGDFLQKIDLSEISFENVSFNNFIIDYLSKEEQEKFLAYYSNLLGKLNEIKQYKFSNTNINIDFSKIHDRILIRVDFSGVDLSKSKGETIKSVVSSNLSNTNINLDFDNIINITDSNLSNNNFKNKEINFDGKEDEFLYNCNLSNTGVRINYNGYNLEQTEDEEEYEEKEFERDTLAQLMRKRYIDHCYVNDKYILTKEEVEKKERENEYLNLVAKIQKEINEEIKRKM